VNELVRADSSRLSALYKLPGFWTPEGASGLRQAAVVNVALSLSLETIFMSSERTVPVESPSPQLLDVRAVAAMLDCSARHVYRMVDAGQMPSPVRLGSLVRWSLRTIEQWIADGCKQVRTAGRRGEQ
jgi:excisionase family DNA binding protein